MAQKTIKKIEKGRPINVGSMKVRELLPTDSGFFNPFLVFHHAETVISKTIPICQQGVGPHPHRGFSPVSFIYRGGVHHRDSRGNNSIIYEGGTQWMNTGMGVIHSERVPDDIFEHSGEQELLQVWVNSPAKNKMDPPAYYPSAKEETPTLTSKDGLVTLRLPAGKLDNVSGKIPTLTPVTTIMGEAKKGGTYTFNFPKNQNSLLYVLSGKIIVNRNTEVNNKELILFNKDGESFDITALENSKFFVGSGEPIDEPIEARGPFVMNTSSEIMEAYRDYQMGKMGVLIED